MLIVSSENSENRPKIEYFDVSSLEISENIRKFIKNRPKRSSSSSSSDSDLDAIVQLDAMCK